MTMIHLKNVTKRYGDVVALQGMTLEIHSGEYITILGPTGSGKTTTLRLIAGLTQPDSGDILFDKRSILKKPPEEREVGYVFQNFVLFPHLNTWNNVAFGGEVKGWSGEKTSSNTRKMLELVRLHERADAFPVELSGGMQQRVALARALASGAKILLLDEPIGALDARLRMSLRYELRRLVKDLGLTAIHVTHDQEEAMAISDRIVILRRGVVQQVGFPMDLYTHPRSIFVANFIGEATFLAGTIKERDDVGSSIELRGGGIVRVSDLTHRIGDLVTVGIRPELANLTRGEKETENALFGLVERRTFVGRFVYYSVRLDNGEIFLVKRRPETAPQVIDTKLRVTVSFSPDDAFVFAHPKEGLMAALEVD